MKFTLKNFLLLIATFFCAERLGYAQGVDTIVEIPTTAHGSALVEIPTARTDSQSNAAENVTLAGEYKSTKNVVEEQKPVFWTWLVDAGYETEYNFRGTDLMPDSDGGVFVDAAVTKWDFTLGLFWISQLGNAHSNSFSIGEGGGGGTGGISSVGTYTPTTVQTRFEELDLFLTYRREFGPLEVTVGDIGFFINRDAQTFLNTSLLGLYGPFATVGDERFDRIFVRLATSIIPHIQPWITYYQTLYSEGQDHHYYQAFHIPFTNSHDFVRYGSKANNNFHERNDRLGGYLEGRLRGSFPIGEWVDFNPYGVLSVSFHDRTEPVPGSTNFRDIIRGRTLSGFNVAQVGLELPIHLFHFVGSSTGPYAPPDARFNLIPFGAYSYHISLPNAGTDRNEGWGGVKLAVTF